MKKYLEILKKCPLFFGIDEENLLRMLTCLGARVDHYDKSYTVMAEGGACKHIGIVLDGCVLVTGNDYYGNRSIISVINPSETFMAAFAMSGVEHLPLSVVADRPSVIMTINGEHILSTCSNNCSFHKTLIFNLMRDLARKTVEFHKRAGIISKRSTREKLLEYLMTVSKQEGKREFFIPFDRQQLADYLEVDRSGLSTEIGKLKSEGIIENKKNYFKLM